ncbi:nucleobase:cation symporter-2 family protein [Erwinia amylovora]|uniref:nucleobase:cation symporter-2 family protein n=1 Tax=Erwinia amylovora TaxID=552 RepID=UPI001443F3C1|nr:nucleobase:cation symporter-2 family protein [Erwinia amylovora]
MSVRPEDTRYPAGRAFAWGLQHVLTMYGGIIAPPLIIGAAAGLDASQLGVLVTAALFVSGGATLLQALGLPGLGARLPLVQGVSFAGVATMVTLVNGGGGLPVVFGAVIASSLMPVAARWAMGGTPQMPGWGSPHHIGLAAATLMLVLLLNRVGNAAIKRLAVLLAIVAGTVIALLTGQADFSAVVQGQWLALPGMFNFGRPVFDVAAIVSMTLIVLVLLAETTAGLLAIGDIIGSEVDGKRISRGLRADMLTSAMAPLFNSFPQSAFAQNIGLVAMTGVKSRFVVAAGGVILLLLGFLPLLGRVVASIPMPVLGGAGVVLFGTVAASGIRILAKVDYQDNMNLVIVATSIAFGMFPIVMPSFYDQFPGWVRTIFHSGISAACLVSVTLNLIFNRVQDARSEKAMDPKG